MNRGESSTSVLDFPGGQYEVLVGCVLVTSGQERRKEGNGERKEIKPHLHRDFFSCEQIPAMIFSWPYKIPPPGD